MKTLPVIALAIGCLFFAGCETNHPQETPQLVEESAASLPNVVQGSLDGWWVKVCPKKTEATWFRISIGPDDHNITQKIVWRTGDPLEFQLVHTRDYNQIFVAAYSGEDGKRAYFGVCHDTQVCCRHYEVNQTESTGGEGHLIKSSDTEVWDCQ